MSCIFEDCVQCDDTFKDVNFVWFLLERGYRTADPIELDSKHTDQGLLRIDPYDETNYITSQEKTRACWRILQHKIRDLF